MSWLSVTILDTNGFTKSSGRRTSVAFKAETLQLPRCKTAFALITVDIT